MTWREKAVLRILFLIASVLGTELASEVRDELRAARNMILNGPEVAAVEEGRKSGRDDDVPF